MEREIDAIQHYGGPSVPLRSGRVALSHSVKGMKYKKSKNWSFLPKIWPYVDIGVKNSNHLMLLNFFRSYRFVPSCPIMLLGIGAIEVLAMQKVYTYHKSQECS